MSLWPVGKGVPRTQGGLEEDTSCSVGHRHTQQGSGQIAQGDSTRRFGAWYQGFQVKPLRNEVLPKERVKTGLGEEGRPWP